MTIENGDGLSAVFHGIGIAIAACAKTPRARVNRRVDRFMMK